MFVTSPLIKFTHETVHPCAILKRQKLHVSCQNLFETLCINLISNKWTVKVKKGSILGPVGKEANEVLPQMTKRLRSNDAVGTDTKTQARGAETEHLTKQSPNRPLPWSPISLQPLLQTIFLYLPTPTSFSQHFLQ